MRADFVQTLEHALILDEQVLYWPWGTPSVRYYSPNAIVALLIAEDPEGGRTRVAQQFGVPWDELSGPLEARQRSWYLNRQLGQLLVAERRHADQIRGDAYWAESHVSGNRAQDQLQKLLEATGHGVQRWEVAEVLAAHDGYGLQWSWYLDPKAREQLRHHVRELRVWQLRAHVATAADLLRTRPTDPSVTMANTWATSQLLQRRARRGRAWVEDCQADLGALSARRVRHRRTLQRQIGIEQAQLERLDERLRQLRQAQDRLDTQRLTRRRWEARPEHVEVLAWGELSAERLRLLEFGALLRVEADPPPYLQSTIGSPFSAQQPVGRRAWLRAAWTIERLRADRGVSDPDIALGLEPTDADARRLYDLACQTLTVLRRDLGRLRTLAASFERSAVELAHEPSTRLLDGPGL